MIVIALGANLPGRGGVSPLETCNAAVQFLLEMPELTFVALSSWFRTVSMPRADLPDYCNGIICFQGAMDPEVLLAHLHDIEARFGRERTESNAPRTLDLDLIDMNGMIRATPAPIL